MLTLMVPAAHTALTTIAALRADIAGDAPDAALDAAIAQASAAVCSWCGRSFALETVRETFHLMSPAGTLVLSRWPVREIVAAATEGGAIPAGRIQADASGLLHLLDGQDRLHPWPAGRVCVDYVAGFILPGDPGRTLPHDIERAVIMLAKNILQGAGQDSSISARKVEDIGERTFWLANRQGGMTPEVETLLAPYRVPGIA